jgi:multimeric flavodoxin WrbA
MKVLTILGSPKKHGNTATVLERFEVLVAPQYEVERVDVMDYHMGGCLGCQACQRVLDRPGCAQNDDATELLDRVAAADVIVFASPLYCWSFSGQIKTLMDRHYCMVKFGADGSVAGALLKGKRAVLLVTCAGPVEGNADLVQTVFDRTVDYLQCESAGKFVVPFCTVPQQLGEASEKTAQAMAASICG